jgi:hypothetical protein
VDSNELTRRSWDDYKAACELCITHFGKARLVGDLDPDDFGKPRATLANGWGPVTLGNVIQRIRVVFKFAYDGGLVDRPVRYGPNFKRPSRKVVRVDRAKKGPKLFSADEVRALIDGALVVGDGPELVRAGDASDGAPRHQLRVGQQIEIYLEYLMIDATIADGKEREHRKSPSRSPKVARGFPKRCEYCYSGRGD